ncbi:beta-lactamase/transpeptidase-like protein [Setomelanomma holmii]|uniref:Beta-lactamase/transpeptidase-like protein n=1 Tax=Setomelanomma holmii TaxID=210430 RepID=A0A9P4LR44_9PLEO|nr:beta-lactamase/transpeptidase-like protein [Setomelanomma holmii]
MAHTTPKFEQLVLDTMKEWSVPGLSLAVISESLFDCASTSKTFTAAAAALLVDDDKYPEVQWTTPVSKLLPDDFVLPNPQLTEDVTIEDVLSHRTGIATHDESYLSIRAKNPDNAMSMTRNLRDLPWEKPLRTGFIYSNIMYSVASYLVKTITGEPYLEFIHKRLWEPLGMTNTFHDLPGIEAGNAMSRKATGYRIDKTTKEDIPISAVYQPESQGAGSVYSSAGDYAKWVRALMKRKLPLSESVQKELVTPRSIDPPNEKYALPFHSDPLYALGLHKESYRGRTLIGHGGAVPGFKAEMCYLPELDWGVVIFGNTDLAWVANETLVYTLIDDVMGVPAADRVDWGAFFRRQHERFEEEDKESVAGRYFDPRYKELAIEWREGKMAADCTDRCFPFVLTFEHLTEEKFVVELHDQWEDEKRKLKGEVRIDEGQVVSVGVGFEKDIEGGLIWFHRSE